VSDQRSGEPLLVVEDLRTQYTVEGRVADAVDGVSFTVNRGEIFGIAGESGSGKTTLALSLMRLVAAPRGRIVSGSALLDGVDLLGLGEAEMSDRRGRQLAMIFQDPMRSLDPAFRIGEQLAETIRRHQGVSRAVARQRSVELLKLVNIPEPETRFTAFPHEFSGGMQQRVMIAIALSCQPALLIADNPTTALDVTIQLQILALVRDLRDRLGMAIIWITHDLGLVARLCDRVAIMYAGKLLEVGPTADVLRDPRHPYTQGLIKSLPRLGTGEDLDPIPGRHPESVAIPAGCAFHPRCGFAMDVCRDGEVPVRRPSPERSVRCWLSDETAA
jgi:oligopeptide/dipeptide ABC transporter ATP-binding protein